MINTAEKQIMKEHIFVDNIASETEALSDLMYATFEEYMTSDQPPEFDRWINLTRMVRAQLSMIAHISEMLEAFGGEDPKILSQAWEIKQSRQEDVKQSFAESL